MATKIGIVVAVIVGGLFILTVIGAMAPQKTPSQRVMESCQREFGDEGQEKVNECAIQIMTEAIQKDQDDRMKRAANY